MGLNVPEWIWMNLRYALIISVLSRHNKRYAPVGDTHNEQYFSALAWVW